MRRGQARSNAGWIALVAVFTFLAAEYFTHRESGLSLSADDVRAMKVVSVAEGIVAAVFWYLSKKRC